MCLADSSTCHAFYAEENQVYRPNLRGIVGGFGRLYDDLTSWRFDA
jgi:hypothetical protein